MKREEKILSWLKEVGYRAGGDVTAAYNQTFNGEEEGGVYISEILEADVLVSNEVRLLGVFKDSIFIPLPDYKDDGKANAFRIYVDTCLRYDRIPEAEWAVEVNSRLIRLEEKV